ncbi:MAG: hypothetical protein ACMXYK_04410 [Candidatus Woesearchaeota archaeon]
MTTTKQLTMMLCLPALTGAITVASISGLLTVQHAVTAALTLLAGPGTLLTAAMHEGNMPERLLGAGIALIIASIATLIAAGFGSILLGMVNETIVRIAGGIAIMLIGLLIIGISIPEKLPLIVLAGGIIASIIMR